MRLFKLLALSLTTALFAPTAEAAIKSVSRINPTTVEIVNDNGNRMTVEFYGNNIFRLFRDDKGGTVRPPKATPPAQILVDNPRRAVEKIAIKDEGDEVIISTNKVAINLNKKSELMTITNLETGKKVVEQITPITFDNGTTSLGLKENPTEYFYGGGVQNGRFSHKGRVIAIENQNSWTDGGVASPAPFYWSTDGYGIMWHTFKKGKYDFGAREKGKVNLMHEDDYLDMFVMVNDCAVPLLNDYYQLTGNPILVPKFGFYQGHLNAYNRDYWAVDTTATGVMFEDGKRYKESQRDNGGVKESLNGEKNNYQFSARAVIDRYKAHDMPFGWLLPNDGYGAGYGQEETLDGNIENLRRLGEYGKKNGVEIGLWTQSDLHPKPEISALLQRDLVKEVRDAGVRVLKTDVAWVGAGYSFGLNGIADAAGIMEYYGNDARPFIITLDGWAGTQRYGGIWSGDQTGGVWEYIRFHIPTYIGSGLSGNPNISSDMDGIFGGKNPAVNIRDFQWKTFTPQQLNMDGWGANEKYPHALGEPATSINRWYLKLRSQFMPYIYSVARQAVDGLPMVRAMFLEYPNPYTLGKATQYQFLFGPYILVAPIYQATASDEKGNDIRNGIYLPEGIWIDFFTGEKYEGGKVINSCKSPIWKMPLFVKNGAILPLANPNNNVSEINKELRIYELYPAGNTKFTEYDDDGLTQQYTSGKGVTTLIESNADQKGNVTVTVNAAKGSFDGFVREKATEFRLNATAKPKKITLMSSVVANGKSTLKPVKLAEAKTLEEYEKGSNIYYWDVAPNLNQFATAGSEFAKEVITKNPVLRVKSAKTDITLSYVRLEIEGYQFDVAQTQTTKTGTLSAPANAQVKGYNTKAYTLKPTWDAVANADFYEIEFDNMLYSTIRDTTLLFENLLVETPYQFKLRSVNKDGASPWATLAAKTTRDPLEFAIRGIRGETTSENQGRSLLQLFDLDEGNLWHTKYNEKAVPFDLIADLVTVNQLDKLEYLPRDNAGNGTILRGRVATSMDKENWSEAGEFEWARDGKTKLFTFTEKPTARFVKISVEEGVGNYGSGRELYIFKVEGSESYLPGDINNDGKVDENDFTSYMNYTGLRSVDADFEYIARGDINNNKLIDVYDISVVATVLEGGVRTRRDSVELAGKIELKAGKQNYAKDEIVEIVVSGKDLQYVNGLSFALPYDAADLEFVTIEAVGMKEMVNLTNDRLHSNGTKALYPTFVNKGNKETLSGDGELMKIKFKARRPLKFNLRSQDGIIIDKKLNTIKY